LKVSMSLVTIMTALCIVAVVFCACDSEQQGSSNKSYTRTITSPSGYLELSVSPGNISAIIGEDIAVCCSTMSLINTPVELASMNLSIFDSHDLLIRGQPMNLNDPRSACTTYIIVGDEAYYKIGVKFSTPLSLPPTDYSEYSLDSFSISVIQ